MSDGRRGRVRDGVVRARATAGVAFAQLADHPLRTALVVVGVAVAVLSVTLLAGTGLGVLETGERQFESADRDLWVTAGETRLTPSRGGGFENVLTDSRSRAAEIESHEAVENAIPIAFETVYVETGDGEYETIVATGVPGTGPAVQLTEGRQFSDPGRHYADGSYDGG